LILIEGCPKLGKTMISDKRSRWSRREFLAAATLSAAAAALSRTGSSLAAETSASNQRPIAVGFLGSVHSHALEKLKIVHGSKDYELIGVDEESQSAKENCEKMGVKIVSRQTVLERAELVVVESAVRDHARDALQALRAGKHVHVEKPPAATLREVQEMVALAREKRRVLQTGYMWRCHPGFAAIFEAARQGWLGEIFQVQGTINNHLAPARRSEWGEFKGGSMFELGSHLIDVTVRLLGKPKSVTPFLRRHGNDTDSLKDNNLAVLEYEKATAVITNSALQPTGIPERSFEALGSKGSAILRPIEPPGLQMEFVTAAGPYKKGIQTISLPGYKRFETDFVELAAAVRGERPLPVTFEQEVEVQETLLRASGML